MQSELARKAKARVIYHNFHWSLHQIILFWGKKRERARETSLGICRERLLLHLIGAFSIFACISSLKVKRNGGKLVVRQRGRGGAVIPKIMKNRDGQINIRQFLSGLRPLLLVSQSIVFLYLRSSFESGLPLSDQSLFVLSHILILPSISWSSRSSIWWIVWVGRVDRQVDVRDREKERHGVHLCMCVLLKDRKKKVVRWLPSFSPSSVFLFLFISLWGPHTLCHFYQMLILWPQQASAPPFFVFLYQIIVL